MAVTLFTFVAIFVFFLAGSHGQTTTTSMTQSLNGTWIAKKTDSSYEFPATVPGGIYTDLMNMNIIDDVFYGYSDNSTRWVGNINWTYVLNFTTDDGLLDYEQVNLVFEGVDTFATIELNNVTIGETKNMFVRYIFDVKDVLKAEGNNTIKIFFANPVERGFNLNKDQLKNYKIPWECPPDAYRGECHINMIRKMQASFSWDWGPSFPSMGIWKSVFLEAYNETIIRYVTTVVEQTDEMWVLHVNTYFANNKRGVVNGTFMVFINLDVGQVAYQRTDVYEKPNEHGEIVKNVVLSNITKGVRLWWPNGYGDQPLYKVGAVFHNGENMDFMLVTIGFRTVELVQQPLDTGTTFYFKINGVPIFAKGSNEIPINILPELGQDPQTIRHLLQSAKDVNMNMLRVWGGGVYESDYFYELANEMGILIWQDFMFACSLYPATDEFLSNVVPEIDHNIKRLISHPSIVVFSGNNENEGVLADNVYNTTDNYDQYKRDYVKLYINTIRSEIERLSEGRAIFISSSPTNGNLTESEGWVGQSPSNQFWGDVHYYNYARDPWDSNTYPIPRFCSEYGYQSLPFEDAWMTATNNTDDLLITSDFMDWRQHHPGGNSELALLIAENLNIPDAESESYASAFIYLSQVYTAQAIKVETEHYRRYRSFLTDDGKGYTMGALYWQLNDVWVAPTWSSIDYTGRWKMLHYFAKDFFANVIVTGYINSARELQLYTVNDQLSDVTHVSIIIRLYKYDSPDFTPLKENRTDAILSASTSELIQTIKIDDFLAENDCDKNSCFFYFLIQEIYSVENSVAENYVFPGKLKDSSLPEATVKIESVGQVKSKTYYIVVKTDNIALFVWLDSHAVRGKFSENGFLQFTAIRVVTFYSDEDITVEVLEDALTVTHLKDSR